jgi:uncharacterized membrane protein
MAAAIIPRVQSERPVPPGLTPERVGFFTDAVFAIAMTLLVIDVPKPGDGSEFDADTAGKAEAARNMLHFLGREYGSLISYLLAFVILWVVWRQHHHLFDRIERLSPRLVAWHLPLLLLIGFMPYLTDLYDEHISNPVGAALFTLGMTGLFGIKTAAQSRALRDGLLRDDVDPADLRGDVRIGWVVTGFFAATLLLCWWTPWVMIAWDLGPVLAMVLNRRRNRRLVAA